MPASRPWHRSLLAGLRARVGGCGAQVLRGCAERAPPPEHFPGRGEGDSLGGSGPAVTVAAGPSLDTRILRELRSIVGKYGLLTEPEDLRTYECDGLTNFRALPMAVLLPASTEEVQAIVRICHRERIPFVARGAGT